MISIEEHCQKFETKVLKDQEKKGKNSKTKEHFDETVKRLKQSCKKEVPLYLGFRTFLEENLDILQ